MESGSIGAPRTINVNLPSTLIFDRVDVDHLNRLHPSLADNAVEPTMGCPDLDNIVGLEIGHLLTPLNKLTGYIHRPQFILRYQPPIPLGNDILPLPPSLPTVDS